MAQADYGLESLGYELNHRAATLAMTAARAWTEQTPDRPRFVVQGPRFVALRGADSTCISNGGTEFERIPHGFHTLVVQGRSYFHTILEVFIDGNLHLSDLNHET